MNVIVAIVAIVLASAMPSRAGFPDGAIVDLSHPFDEKTIYWPTEKGFSLQRESDGMTEKGYYYRANKFFSPEHGGTHLDAPSHFWRDGIPVDAIPLEHLVAPAVVVDVTRKCRTDRDYQVTIDDFVDWEKTHKQIPDDSIVLVRTGFGKHWPNRKSYLGTDELGPAALAKLHFPGIHPDAATWLVREREVKAVGLDTASLDYGQSTLFETHVALFRHNVPGMENLANLERLPPTGITVVALPMKIRGGSGAPLRVIAIVEQK
ncbi:MAG: cyclase family protein [Candidatus Binatia bacterium]